MRAAFWRAAATRCVSSRATGARSLQLANALDVEIICGDGTNIDMLENAGVRDADCLLRYPVTMRIISLRRSLQSSISARKK